jgi:hypothetical protein
MLLTSIASMTLFGNALLDAPGLAELLIHFTINLLVVYIVIGRIFYSRYRSRSYHFAYCMINICVFLVSIILSSVKMKIGFAFGLFAVFSIIRYRTEQIPVREMTYLFVAIIIGVLNALSVKRISYAELLTSNTIIVGSIYWLEYMAHITKHNIKQARYEKIELIAPERREELLADLKERTGLRVIDVDIEDIDFLNDTANIKIYYTDRH